jgi:hypothetical protein
VVAVKIVASGEPGNERSVMKNAHEIAILSALSHPNILQARAGLGVVDPTPAVGAAAGSGPPARPPTA